MCRFEKTGAAVRAGNAAHARFRARARRAKQAPRPNEGALRLEGGFIGASLPWSPFQGDFKMPPLSCGQGCVMLGREACWSEAGPRDVPARSGLVWSRTPKECLSPSVRSCPLRPGDRSRSASPKPRSNPVAVSQTEFDALRDDEQNTAFALAFAAGTR